MQRENDEFWLGSVIISIVILEIYNWITYISGKNPSVSALFQLNRKTLVGSSATEHNIIFRFDRVQAQAIGWLPKLGRKKQKPHRILSKVKVKNKKINENK